MKTLFLETAKVVGTSTRDSWSQTHYFTPREAEKKQARGDLLAVLSLSGLEAGVEAVASGREVIARLHEEYYGNLEQGVLERLGGALSKIGTELGGEARINIVAAAFLDSRLYAGILGEGKLLFLRGGQIGEILTGGPTVVTTSGYLQKTDLFLLGTKSFFDVTASGVLRAALSSDSLLEASETLAAVVHGQEKSGAAAALIVKVGPEGGKALLGPSVDRKGAEGQTMTAKASVLLSPRPFFQKTVLSFVNFWSRLLGKKTISWRWPEINWENWLKSRLKKQRSTRSLLTTVIFLLLLLLVSVGFGVRQRRQKDVEGRLNQVIAEAEQRKVEAEALIDLNPSRARELLLEARGLVDQVGPEKESSARLTALEAELERLINLVVKERRVNAAGFFDLEMIKKGAEGDDLAFSGDKFFVLDRNLSSLYEIEVANKKMAIVAGGKALEGSKQVAAFLPQVWVLTDQALMAYHRQTGREEVVFEIEDGAARDLEAFSGNLYLLDRQGLWQYPATESGLGSRRSWLQGESHFDFEAGVSLAVDGSIWVVAKNGAIGRFNRGRQEAFGVAGLDYVFGEVLDLFTDENQENLYLLDSKGAVVVIGKSGEYQAAYLSDDLAGATNLTASEAAGKIWILKGGEILVIDLAAD